MKPRYLDEALKDCVDKTSQDLLPTLQDIDANITGIHFQQGHPKEIIQTLTELSGGITTKNQRYPLVALFRDFTEVEGRIKTIIEVPQLTLIIATRTEPTYKSEQRKEKSFKPVLHPIYLGLKKRMSTSGYFLINGELTIDKTDRYFWGRESVYGAEANIFNDWIDCIELKFTNLKTYLTC